MILSKSSHRLVKSPPPPPSLFKSARTINSARVLLQNLRTLVGRALPQLNVEAVVYPRYETRGDLSLSVSKFREWLQNRVIDIEVAAETPSPMIDPSVRTVLVAHSMGGIIAADTLLSILDDEDTNRSPNTPGKFMFPYIQGILAFDTPFLGLSPAVFANGADTNIRSASSAVSQISALASGFFASRAASEGSKALTNAPASPTSPTSPTSPNAEKQKAEEEPASPIWQRWGKVAAYAGAAGVLAAGGAVAYFKRDEIGQGFSWVSSHLEFVGALMKSEDLRVRTERVSGTEGVGFAVLYTALGDRGKEKGDRTFVILPTKGGKGWFRCVNAKATDEVNAHCSMFGPATNPRYQDMTLLAKELIVRWATNEWSYYTPRPASKDMRMTTQGGGGPAPNRGGRL